MMHLEYLMDVTDDMTKMRHFKSSLKDGDGTLYGQKKSVYFCGREFVAQLFE